MSDFRVVRGFEEVWRPPVRRGVRTPETVFGRGPASDVRARLSRIVRRVPEVMVKVTGRTRDPGHLAAHLSYITRNGDLPAEGRDGWPISGRGEVMELAGDWAAASFGDPRRRRTSPLSLGLILSMPAGTDALRLRDAARAFAAATFAEGFDYLFVLHTDAGHPHVHLTVKAQGDGGERLNPKKADLEAWRQGFARALRDHGIEAEATPRRARGVTRKAERGPVRRLRDRAAQGRGAMPEVRRQAYREAAQAAFGGDEAVRVWERRAAARQAQVRALYLAQARLLQGSTAADDRQLGDAVEAFVRSLAPPDSQRLALARELRAANRSRAPARDGEDRRR
ncbi:MAG: relaxase/mobilization nuclease domain-containing protein [Phenylobacterium sp.]